MDKVNSNEPVQNLSSLEEQYNNFDNWIIQYVSYYKRSMHKPDENESKSEMDTKLHKIIDKIIIDDVFVADILLKHWHRGHTAIQNTAIQNNVNMKENDGFILYDYILYRLIDKNSDRSLIYKYNQSKL